MSRSLNCLEHALVRYDVVFSRNSFASFTFVARYGLPPLSGWLSNMRLRWAFRTLSLVMAPSLQQEHPVSFLDRQRYAPEMGW